jgi:hypothetical protein
MKESHIYRRIKHKTNEIELPLFLIFVNTYTILKKNILKIRLYFLTILVL